MSLTVEQIQSIVTKEDALELVLDQFEALGFPARSYQSGSVNRTEIEYIAELLASASGVTSDISKGGFNDTATDDGLTAFSSSHYENDRVGATRTIGDIKITVASGSGPYSPAIGEVIVEDPDLNLRYRSLTALVLTSAAEVTGSFQAEVAGGDSNSPSGGDIDTLISSFAGVTVTNDADWVTTNGSDAEEDPELKTRNSTKWTLLSENSPKGIFISWALAAASAVTRASVDDTNAAGTGTVEVFIADEVAGLGAPTTTTVLDYINLRKSLGTTVLVSEANSLDVTVTYVATYDSGVFDNDTLAETAVEDALNVFRKSFAVGGEGPVGSEVLPLGSLYAAANAVAGIVNVTFTAPTVDAPMTVDQVAIFTLSGTATAI